MAYSEQQAAVYRGEGRVTDPSALRRVGTETEAQRFTDSITCQDWWAERYPHVVRVEVEALHGNTRRVSAVSRGHHDRGLGVVGIVKEGVSVLTLLHEMAHCVTESHDGHGPVFVREYLTITYQVAGSAAYAELRAALVEAGAEVG